MIINAFTVKFIDHKDITDDLLYKIILLKQQHWKHVIHEQMRWISNNIRCNDKHLILISEANELIAYLNMVNIKINIRDINYDAIGIGNVCVDKLYLGKNLGRLLMNACTFYLRNNANNGILLCKDKLNDFYTKAGWIKYTNKLLINNDNFNDNVFLSDARFADVTQIRIDRMF